MKRGINSLDAFLALMIMLFVVFWMQNFLSLSYGNSQDFGVQIMVDSEAMRVGSIMNAFFATNPTTKDYITLNSSVAVFGENLTCTITKNQGVAKVDIETVYRGVKFNSSYPVIGQIKYDQVNQKVST